MTEPTTGVRDALRRWFAVERPGTYTYRTLAKHVARLGVRFAPVYLPYLAVQTYVHGVVFLAFAVLFLATGAGSFVGGFAALRGDRAVAALAWLAVAGGLGAAGARGAVLPGSDPLGAWTVLFVGWFAVIAGLAGYAMPEARSD